MNAITQDLIEKPLKLPEDISLVKIADLPEELSVNLEAESNDHLISRLKARQVSKIIDTKLASILNMFKEGNRLVDVIHAYSLVSDDNNPKQLMDDIFPAIIDMVNSGFLLPEGYEALKRAGHQYQSGQYFGEYEIIECLHYTDDTELYLLKQSKSYFALKLASEITTATMRKSLQHEAKVLKSLSLDIAPKLIEDGSSAELPYLIISWVYGNRSEEYAANCRKSSDYRSLHQMSQNIVRSYNKLHETGWLHQDVHPGNILCLNDNQVKLIDFALCRSTYDTEISIQAGVSFFMAPESLQAEYKDKTHPLNDKTEQYSIAAVLYYLITGTYTIDFSLSEEKMHQQLRELQPRTFLELGCRAWPEMETVLCKALAKEPHQRYPSLHAFANALAAVRQPKTIRQNTDDDLISKTVNEQINLTIQKLQETKDLFQQGLPHGPTCSINFGMAGIAYALYRFSIARDDALLLELAEKWIHKAMNHLSDEAAFIHPSTEFQNNLVTEVSTYNHSPGVWGAAAMIAHARGDGLTFNYMVRKLLHPNNHLPMTEDLTLGGAGYILMLINLLELSETLMEKKIRQDIEQKIQYQLKQLWLTTHALRSITDDNENHNLGVAHGLSGILYVYLRWYQYFKPEVETWSVTDIYQTIDQLIDQFLPRGCGHCVPWRDGSNNDSQVLHTMSGWCNGSTGVSQLLQLAYELSDEQRYLDYAEKLAWHCWEDTAEIPNLCCGMSGCAYVLSRMAVISGNNHWKLKADNLIARAIEIAGNIDTEDMPFHSLYKGQLGVALAAEEILNQAGSHIPFFDSEV